MEGLKTAVTGHRRGRRALRRGFRKRSRGERIESCTGSPFRVLFGPRAATRLNGPSVYDGALLTQRYVRAIEGEKERER